MKGSKNTKEQRNIPSSVMVTGTFIGNAKGYGFVRCSEESGADIFIPAFAVNGAMHKDEVLCLIVAGFQSLRREGEIVRILKRGYNEIIGTLEKRKGVAMVYPDERKLCEVIFVRDGKTKSAVTGHKVAVRLENRMDDDERIFGTVTDILGHKNDPGVDVYSIVRQAGLRMRFNKKVRAELEQIPEEVFASEIDGRLDLRGKFIITIDGDDTKDIDDAVSLDIIDGGKYRLGVHIADVSHYVAENSALDHEAYQRGTSVYLTDRVIPMLPHKLSNGICSLNAGEDRLSLSCIMTIDSKGSVTDSQISLSVINVKRRTTYEEVDEILYGSKDSGGSADTADDLRDLLANMEGLAKILREKRVRRGALEFDFPEAKIIINGEGWPVNIMPRGRTVSTGIIEEFMIACNETIAETFFWQETPFIYRTHEEPDEEKVRRLSDFVVNFGYSLRKRALKPGSLQGLLARVESKPEEALINRVVLRSLKQARYTPECSGHFGLASKYYCHFTSPIRRYPDLQIHRIIKWSLAGNLEGYRIDSLESALPDICIQCSVSERAAEAVEHEVDKLKKAQFMSDKTGCEFDGMVSGLTGWGVYITLPNTVEGMIPIGALTDDDYIFNQDMMRYEGRLSGRHIRLGDLLRVRVAKVDIDARIIDFEPADSE